MKKTICLVILMMSLTAAFAEWVEVQKLLAVDGYEYQWFGSSVSISGDNAIVGASGDDDSYYNAGAAYIFLRDSDGIWNKEQKIVAGDNGFSHFGSSTSISDDDIIVGATYFDDNYPEVGSAYIFEGIDGVWNQQQQMYPIDDWNVGGFGHVVDISGDNAIVGASEFFYQVEVVGCAYIYHRLGDTWSDDAILIPSDETDRRFGHTVSISDDYAIIGTHDSSEFEYGTGSAYIYHRESTNWVEQVRLTASDPGAFDYFAYDVCISGDVAIVSGYGDDDFGEYSGAAYVYRREGDTWIEEQKLTASDGEAEDFFGYSVSIAGSYAVIGAPGDESGSVYVFHYDGSNWVEMQKLTTENTAEDYSFGSDVAISRGNIIVAAPYDDELGTYAGAAYIFENDDIGVDPDDLPEVTGTVLHGAYPNPFNPSTTISFSLPESGDVTLDIYNIRGEKVKHLLSEHRDAGKHLVPWDGFNDKGCAVASGIYFARLATDDSILTQKMLLLK